MSNDTIDDIHRDDERPPRASFSDFEPEPDAEPDEDTEPMNVELSNWIKDDEAMTPLHYAAIRSDGLTFMACMEAAAGCPELVEQFDRLYKANLRRRGAPIVLMVDDASGKADADKAAFLRFVWNCIFTRCPLTAPKGNRDEH